jgi:acyl-CoA thioester hydrolase
MKLKMIEPIHRSTCRVLYGDTDAGGVVYYGNYLRYFEMARSEFMRDLALSYKKIEERGLVLPVVECYTRYKAPAFYDDLLVVETSLAELKNVSCRFHYRVYRITEADQSSPVLLTKGSTVHAVVDRSGKLRRLPEDILDILKAACPRAAEDSLS